ncbi:MAG TPA: LOG family protein [Candidatus Eisenbacteria bacterium]
MPVATVFGSSTAGPDDPCSREAFALGAGLAGRGFVVRNGGYDGVMAAVSAGARSAGGHVVGVTTAGLDSRRTPNRHLTEVHTEADLFDRLRRLIRGADLFVAFDECGPGTVNEVVLVWALRVVGEIGPDVPLILVGDRWPRLLEGLQGGFSSKWNMDAGTIVVPTTSAALDVIDRRFPRSRSGMAEASGD